MGKGRLLRDDQQPQSIKSRVGNGERRAILRSARVWLMLLAVSILHVGTPEVVAQQQRVINPSIIPDVIYASTQLIMPERGERRGNYVIGVLGAYPYRKEDPNNPLERMRLRHQNTKSGRRIEIKYFSTAAEYQACDMLYIPPAGNATGGIATGGNAPSALLRDVLPIVGNESVIVVGSSPGLARQGALLNILLDPLTNDKEIEINTREAKRLRFKVHPGMLKIAVDPR